MDARERVARALHAHDRATFIDHATPGWDDLQTVIRSNYLTLADEAIAAFKKGTDQ